MATMRTSDELADACAQLVHAVQRHIRHSCNGGSGRSLASVHSELRHALVQVLQQQQQQQHGHAPRRDDARARVHTAPSVTRASPQLAVTSRTAIHSASSISSSTSSSTSSSSSSTSSNSSPSRRDSVDARVHTHAAAAPRQRPRRHVDAHAGVTTHAHAHDTTTTMHTPWYTTPAAWTVVLSGLYMHKRKLREAALACVECLLLRCPSAMTAMVLVQDVTLCTSMYVTAPAAPHTARDHHNNDSDDNSSELAATTRERGTTMSPPLQPRRRHSIDGVSPRVSRHNNTAAAAITGATSGDSRCCIATRAGDGACLSLAHLLLTLQDTAAQLRVLQLLQRLLALRVAPSPRSPRRAHANHHRSSSDSGSSSDDDDDDDVSTVVVVSCHGRCLLHTLHACATLSCNTAHEQVRVCSQRLVDTCVVRATRAFVRDAAADVASADAAATATAAADNPSAAGTTTTTATSPSHAACRDYGDALTTLTLLDDYVHDVRATAPYTRIDVCDHMPGCMTAATTATTATTTTTTTTSSSLDPNVRESGDGCVACKRRCRTLLDSVAEAALAVVRLDGQLPPSLKDMCHVLHYLCTTAAAMPATTAASSSPSLLQQRMYTTSGSAAGGGGVAYSSASGALRARLLALRALELFADELPVANCMREHDSALWLHVLLFACKHTLLCALARCLSTAASPFALFDAAVRVLTRLLCKVHYHLARELYTLLAVLVLPLAASRYASFRHTYAVLTMTRTLLSTPHVCVSLFTNYDANPCCDAAARYGGLLELLLAFVTELLFREHVDDDGDDSSRGSSSRSSSERDDDGATRHRARDKATASDDDDDDNDKYDDDTAQPPSPYTPRHHRRVCRDDATRPTTTTTSAADDASATLLTSDQQQLLRSECVATVCSYLLSLYTWVADEPRVYAQRVHDEAATQHAVTRAMRQSPHDDDGDDGDTKAKRRRKTGAAVLPLPLQPSCNEHYLYDDDDDDDDVCDGSNDDDGNNTKAAIRLPTSYHATLVHAALHGHVATPSTPAAASQTTLLLQQPFAGSCGTSVCGAQSLHWCCGNSNNNNNNDSCCAAAMSVTTARPSHGIGFHWKHIHHRLHNKRLAQRALQLFNDGAWQQAEALLHAHGYVDCDKGKHSSSSNSKDDDNNNNNDGSSKRPAASCTCLARFMHGYPGVAREAICALFDRINKPDSSDLRRLLRDYLRLFDYADVPIDRALRDATCAFMSWERPMFEAQVWATIQEMFGAEYARQNARAMTAKDADTMAGVLLFLHANAHNASVRGDRMSCEQFVTSGNACLDFPLDDREMRAMYARVCRRAWCLDAYGLTPQQAEAVQQQQQQPVRVSALLLQKASERAQRAFAAAASGACSSSSHPAVATTTTAAEHVDDSRDDDDTDDDDDVDDKATKQCVAWLALDEETLQEVAAMTRAVATTRRGPATATDSDADNNNTDYTAAAHVSPPPPLSSLQMLDTHARDVVRLLDPTCTTPPLYGTRGRGDALAQTTPSPSSPASLLPSSSSMAGSGASAATGATQHHLQPQSALPGRGSASTRFARAAHAYLCELERVHYVLYTRQAHDRVQPYVVPYYAAHVRPMFVAAYPQLMACLYMGLRVIEVAPLLQRVQSALDVVHALAAALSLDLTDMRAAVDETIAHYVNDPHAHRIRPPTRETFVTYLCNLP